MTTSFFENIVQDANGNGIILYINGTQQLIPFNVAGALPPVGSIVSYNPGYYSNSGNVSFITTGPSGNNIAAVNAFLAATTGGAWRVCDGTQFQDAQSPIWFAVNSYLPDLTSGVFMRGNSSCGGTGGTASVSGTFAGDAVSHSTWFASAGSFTPSLASDATYTVNDPGHVHTMVHTHDLQNHTHSLNSHTHYFGHVHEWGYLDSIQNFFSLSNGSNLSVSTSNTQASFNGSGTNFVMGSTQATISGATTNKYAFWENLASNVSVPLMTSGALDSRSIFSNTTQTDGPSTANSGTPSTNSTGSSSAGNTGSASNGITLSLNSSATFNSASLSSAGNYTPTGTLNLTGGTPPYLNNFFIVRVK